MSGGLDSSIMAYILQEEMFEVFPFFINYGHLAYNAEWSHLQDICKYLKLNEPIKVDIPDYGKKIPCGITNKKYNIIDQAFLPCRNIIFLVMAAGYAYSKNINLIAIGLLKEYFFPDQTREFITSIENTIKVGLNRDIKILIPLIDLNKYEILKLADENNFPIDMTYSCHLGNKSHCQKCLSCKELYESKKLLDF